MNSNRKPGENNIEILMPSKSLANKIREQYIPDLIEFVIKEKQHFTLLEFLQFLFLYDEITDHAKKENKDDPKLINMLPILVKIAEELLKVEDPNKNT